MTTETSRSGGHAHAWLASAVVLMALATTGLYFISSARPRAAKNIGARTEIIFSGYRFTETEALFSLTDSINRRASGPLRIGESFVGGTVVSFDPAKEILTVWLAGEMRQLPLRGSARPSRPIFFQEPDSGTSGRLEFSGIPLRQIVDHFVAVSGRRITVNPQLGALKVTGHFRKDSVESFLYVLPQIAPVRIEIGSDNSVQILPKEPRNPGR
jgi:hypothetical protein